MKWWNRWVTLPHGLACKASALLVCHDPINEFTILDFRFTRWRVAFVPPEVSKVLETSPRADAQPVLELVNRKSQIVNMLVRLPGIAPGHPPWRGDILLLNHNREIKRAGQVFARPARAISIKNKHLLAIYSTPTRGFTAALSVFRGTPPAKPLIAKNRVFLPGDTMARSRAHHTGDDSMLVFTKINLSPGDITWMSYFYCSQTVQLSLTAVYFAGSAGKTKNPAYFSVSRVGKSLFRFFTCLRPFYPNYLWGVAPSVRWIAQDRTRSPGYTGHDESLSRLSSPANS